MTTNTLREAVRELERYQRPGYSIIYRSGNDGVQAMTTAYLVSHKKRVVGAIAVFRDGSHVKAETPREAAGWFEADS